MSDFANFSNFNDIDLSSPTGSSQPASSNDFDDFVGGRAAKQTFNTGPFNSNGSNGGSNGGKEFGGDVDIFITPQPTAEVPRFQQPPPTTRASGSGFGSNQGAVNFAEARLRGIYDSNNASTGVDPTKGTLTGQLLCRSSARSMLMKAWKPLHFALDMREGTLAVYRTSEDLRRGLAFAKKVLNLEYNFRCTDIKLKEYGTNEHLYHFSLEEVLDFGPSLKMKFASESGQRLLLEQLRAAIHEFVGIARTRRRNRMLNVAKQAQATKVKEEEVEARYRHGYGNQPNFTQQDLQVTGIPSSPPTFQDTSIQEFAAPGGGKHSSSNKNNAGGKINIDVNKYDKWGQI
ncbi:hypothetical protein TL16_g01865 [Triparma laevis f. inornata]|uniref:Uncharacterized protein n=1 Tax=Triparma laevis f. inornata TaxID=1714386 RepID=A0A9W6ZQF4_9STRA|nr:hypothetical protein TL16_g01865 [Triparma laevis f. inornata]